MKRHVWILFIALNSFCCHQQKKTLIAPNDLFFANLKGNIEKVEETSYGLDSTGREMPPDSCCRSIILYDDKGFRISHSNVDIDGNERTSQQYTGRFSNGLVKEIRFTENGKLTSLLLNMQSLILRKIMCSHPKTWAIALTQVTWNIFLHSP